MIRGIAIMGLNGCGKSTLAHAIAKRLDFYEMDVEDYYFPEQKNSRQAILEQQYDVKCEYKGKLPYSTPRSISEVQEMIRTDIEKHPQFVISGVTMNWDEDILSVIDVAFILEVSTVERVRRVQHREEVRFGSRVMVGGDMYEQQKAFREIIGNRSNERVEESANSMHCKKVRLDGTKSIEENISNIMSVLEELILQKSWDFE
ncbi:MAG: hypothetical protein ACI4TA_06185 [Acetatifactor sp.]